MPFSQTKGKKMECRETYHRGGLPQRVAASVEEFMPLPAVGLKVLEMLVDPAIEVADLESVLQGDVTLVSSVLKLANSAFYGFRRQVISLRHALVLLGKGEVQGLVFSKVMLQAFEVSEGRQKEIMVQTWEHFLECALAAESIAEQCGAESSVCFLGGMLHDIGKLILIQKFLEEIEGMGHYQQIVEEDGLKIEKEIFGCGHNDLGAQLLRRWMFPPQLIEMVQEHHNYEGIAGCRTSSQVLILANLLSRWLALTDGEERHPGTEEVRSLLLRCGAESKIIPDEKTLLLMRDAFRQKVVDRADLLEMLAM